MKLLNNLENIDRLDEAPSFKVENTGWGPHD